MTDHPPDPPDPPTLDELVEQVADLDDALTALAGRVADLDAAALAAPAPPAVEVAAADPEEELAAWWWPGLDAQAATAAWGKLGAWVRDALLARHPNYGHTLRPCWRRHPEVVDELTALRLTWLAAYDTPELGPTAAADYLGRWLPQAMTRIEAVFSRTGCVIAAGQNVHKDDQARWLPHTWTGEQVAEFITEDITDRPTPPDPPAAGRPGRPAVVLP